MFVALELLGPKRGILSRALDRIVRPRPVAEELAVAGHRFHRIRAPVSCGEPDWRAVAELADRLLLPDGVAPPEASPIRPLPCPRYERRVLLATACAVIARTRMPMYRRVLGFVDRECADSELLFPLLHHFTTVRVLTDRPDRYRAVAEEMMELLGAPVLIDESGRLPPDCVLLLAPGGPDTLPHPPACPLLLYQELEGAGDRILHGLRPAVSGEIAAATPRGTAPHRFAAALYDWCDLASSERDRDYAAVSLRMGSRGATLDDAARCVLAAAARGIP